MQKKIKKSQKRFIIQKGFYILINTNDNLMYLQIENHS